MAEIKPIRDRPRGCPWVNYPTHNKNRDIQVNGEVRVDVGRSPTAPLVRSFGTAEEQRKQSGWQTW